MADEEDAPPAVPEWEPGELAWRIARGHAQTEHFPDHDVDDLAQMIPGAFDRGEQKVWALRTLYWDEQQQLIVIVNPEDPDGGTAFPSYRDFFEDWGRGRRNRS